MSKKSELVERIKEEILELTDYADILDVTAFACERCADIEFDSYNPELFPCMEIE